MAGEATIFIPGIKGTKLVETNLSSWDTIWSGVQSNFETIEDLELTAAYKNRFYEESPHSIIRPGEIEELAYAEFLGDLRTEAPVYIFNYDWRFSASENGERLADFIDYLINKSKARGEAFKKMFPKAHTPISSFNFITHSLGNFILRNYLHNHGFAKVNRIVFTVPPFRGSLDILSSAVVGEGWFPGVRAKIRKLIRVMPGALELLPSYDGATRHESKPKHTLFTFDHWQGNIVDRKGRIKNKMKKALSLAKDVVENQLCDLSKLGEEERSRILIIARGGYDTWQSIPVLQRSPDGVRNFVQFDDGLRTKDGDGRVPHVSSCCYWDKVSTVVIEDAFWFADYSHAFVLKDERVQKLVNRFLYPQPNRKKFTWKIPGGSIGQVTNLILDPDDASGLPRWRVQIG